jgi:ribose transport system ATP-binding protein
MTVLGVRVNSTIQSIRQFSFLNFLRRRAERKAVRALVDQLEIRTPSLEQPVAFLSGGNQQKVVVSRTFLTKPAAILAYEPTQGVDVGSRFDIYQALRARTNEGAAVLVKSSDPLELAGLCDRVLVLSRGQIIEEIPGEELTEVRIVEAIVRGPGLSKAGRSPLGVAMPKATTGGENP